MLPRGHPLPHPRLMAADSIGGEPPAPETKPIQLPGPRSRSLLRFPPELALYVSRSDDTLVRLNQYAPDQLAVASVAMLTAHLKTPYHNSRPRISALNPKLRQLPSHVPPRPFSVPRKTRPPSLPHSTPLSLILRRHHLESTPS